MDDFSRVLDGFSNVDRDFVIICGDFNAWHTDWGDRSDGRGKRLLAMMDDLDFEPLRLPTPTRFGNSRQQDTYPDVIFVSHFSSFSKVIVGPKLSDHAFCQSTFSLDLAPNRGHHVYDFRATYKRGRMS